MLINNKYKDDPRIFILPFDKTAKKKSSWINLLFVVGIAVFQVLMGVVNQDSSRTAWIVFPYLAAYLPLIYAFFGVSAYWEAGTEMSCIQYQFGLMRIRRSLIAVLLITAADLLADVVYIILYRGQINIAAELVFLGLHIPVMAGVIWYGTVYDKLYAGIVTEEPKE